MVVFTSARARLPANGQTGSRLLKLPAEVRLIVLRKLLRLDKPIYSLSSTDDIEYIESIQRTAQLLRTCQLLYHEGTAILYNENTLCIDFMAFENDDGEEAVHFCGILEMYLPVPGGIQAVDEGVPSLLSYATPTRAASTDDTGVMSSSVQRLSAQWQMLSRFTNYHVRVQYASQQIIFSASQLLQDILHSKDVKFTIHMVDEDEDYRIPESEADKSALQMLQSCVYLHCKGIQFETHNFTASPPPKPATIDGVEHLVALITNSEVMHKHNIHREWLHSRARLYGLLEEEELIQESMLEMWPDEFIAILQSTMDNDQMVYKDKLRKLLEKIREYLRDATDERLSYCENDVERQDEMARQEATLKYLDAHFITPCLR